MTHPVRRGRQAVPGAEASLLNPRRGAPFRVLRKAG